MQRPQFELFDIASDPDETTNLPKAWPSGHSEQVQEKMKQMQKEMEDPWIAEVDYE